MVIEERKLPAHYFDDEETDNLYKFPVVLADPTFFDIQEMRKLEKFNRGVMLVTGKAGAGKDLFGVFTAYENKRFWGRPILLDFKPRRLFGGYTYFDPLSMQREIDKLARAASLNENNPDEQLTQQQTDILKDATDEWIEANRVLLEGSVLYLSELRRYCYNRNPHNRLNKSIGALCTQWRHLDMLIIGTHIQEHEIDRYTFKGNLTHWVECKWMLSRLNSMQATIRPWTALTEFGNFDLHLKAETIQIDGSLPRRFLSKPDTAYGITPDGRRLLATNGTGLLGIEILEFLEDNGAKEAQEVSAYFRAKNGEVDDILFKLVEQGYAKGNRPFDLYNSKNKVNLKPEVRR